MHTSIVYYQFHLQLVDTITMFSLCWMPSPIQEERGSVQMATPVVSCPVGSTDAVLFRMPCAALTASAAARKEQRAVSQDVIRNEGNHGADHASSH